MDESKQPPDDLRVRLKWPGTGNDDAPVFEPRSRVLKGFDEPVEVRSAESEAPTVDQDQDQGAVADGDAEPGDQGRRRLRGAGARGREHTRAEAKAQARRAAEETRARARAEAQEKARELAGQEAKRKAASDSAEAEQRAKARAEAEARTRREAQAQRDAQARNEARDAMAAQAQDEADAREAQERLEAQIRATAERAEAEARAEADSWAQAHRGQESENDVEAGFDADVEFEVADELGHREEDDRSSRSDRFGASSQALSTQELILAGRSDSLQAALASIALRIDTLTSTTSTFRNLISDRVTDYAEQVGRFSTSAAGDLEDYRRLHERSLEEIRHDVSEADENVRRLSRAVGDLELKIAALIAAVRENGDAVDHLASERDQMSDTLLRSLDRVGQQVELGLEQGMEEQAAALGRLAETVAGLADDRERGTDALRHLQETVADLSASRERGAARAMSRLESRLAEVATAVAEVAGQDLPGALHRLDTRLRELTALLGPGPDQVRSRGGPRLASLDRGPGGETFSSEQYQQLMERIDQVGQRLGDQIETLRRRIALRARPATQSLDAEVIEAIAEAVMARLGAAGRPALPPPPALPPAPAAQPRPILRSGAAGPESQTMPRGPRSKRP